MAEIKKTQMISSLPGIRRDGTRLDGDYFSDGQWVRFQRGRPKKMGGFQMITNQLSGPSRAALVWSRESMNAIYSFSPYGIEMVLVDGGGSGTNVIDRSPAGFTANSNAVWSVDTQYDSMVGTTATIVVAHANSSLTNIDSTTASKPYMGVAATSTVFTEITDAPSVSGGVFATPPYTCVYGSDGLYAWSDINKPQVWSTSAGNIGDAGTARITGAKIIKALPLRSGSGPGALIWSLDSVIRKDYLGAASTFRFTHLSKQSSVLGQNGIIEYDGMYFWMGVDRFLMCDGSAVRELPNQMNINWVFDNLNFAQRQKVWAMKIPRYGEIHWYFPFGPDATECTHCVIYNVRENLWYDNRNARSSGFASQVFRYPVMVDSQPSQTEQRLTLSGVTGSFVGGDVVVDSTGAKAAITYVSGTELRVHALDNRVLTGTTLTNQTRAGSATIATNRALYTAFLHEKGYDHIEEDKSVPIESYFETADFGYPTGGPQPNQQEGINRWTRLVRIEPDFIQQGEMSVEVVGNEFANAPDKVSSAYNFTNSTQRIDMREQRREIHLKFTSNVTGGHYEMGRTLLHTELGDVRS